jgi:hypothetical protein
LSASRCGCVSLDPGKFRVSVREDSSHKRSIEASRNILAMTPSGSSDQDGVVIDKRAAIELDLLQRGSQARKVI